MSASAESWQVLAHRCSDTEGGAPVAHASGVSRNTVIKAEREVEDGIEPSERLRALGAVTGLSSTSSPDSWRLSTISSTPIPAAIRCLCSLDL